MLKQNTNKTQTCNDQKSFMASYVHNMQISKQDLIKSSQQFTFRNPNGGTRSINEETLFRNFLQRLDTGNKPKYQ